jgi:hypothetical protein
MKVLPVFTLLLLGSTIFSSKATLVGNNFSDDEDTTLFNPAYPTCAGTPVIDQESKYFQLGEQLATLLKQSLKAHERGDREKSARIRDELKELESTVALQKLNDKLVFRNDIISAAKLSTFVEGVCSTLGIENIRELEDYTPLNRAVTEWSAYTRAGTLMPFSDKFVAFLSHPDQFPLFAELYERALYL